MSINKKENLKEAQSAAQGALDVLKNGKTYTSNYVINRFEKAASQHSSDQLIGNMRDVLTKVASKREYIHQNEIGKLYNEMYGLSGGQTAFRNVLGDLLPESLQFSKVAYSGSKNRAMEENKLEPVYKDSDLSNAFSVLFSLGGDSSFGTFKPGQDKSVQKAVIAKLSSLGHTPLNVEIVETNEHFVLCAATHQTTGLTKVSTFIPVQITDGVTQEPKLLVMGEQVVELDARNLFTCIKEQERTQKNQSKQKFASERGTDNKTLEISKAVVPTSLESFADLENTLIAAASNFDTNKIKMAIAMLDGELKSFGLKNTNIKIAGSDNVGVMFNVYIPTQYGKTMITVPVEITNNVPLLPVRFASNDNKKDQMIFNFNRQGFEKFITSLNESSHSLKLARISGELSKMSYQQLMDQMIDGISHQDYKLAEDVLQTINQRFGSDKYLVAFDQYSQLLKHSSNGSRRKELIKAAFERGDLIKVPTSVDLYCPKLGLPISKVSFDEKGRVIPMSRSTKSENQIQDTVISTTKIVFT